MKKLELLAPAGSYEAMLSAVENGADAVYFGGKKLSARQSAENFTDEQMIEAVKYCKLRGVKTHITVNTLYRDDELREAVDYVGHLWDIGADSLIVQDLGLVYAIRKLFPDFPMSASTQMTINNLHGVRVLEELGFKRAVLAREISLKEIEYISENSPMELEVFAHGALCVSYSGQCLMSSFIGGRSGNRGRCAQACRMPSSIVDRLGRINEDYKEKYLLSPKDLNVLEHLDKLKAAGVTSIKIEGRMKRPEYVGTIVKAYRKAIDYGFESIDDRDLEDVLQIFNRGFTKGFTFGDFGDCYIGIERPDNRGIELGEVKRISANNMYVELFTSVGKGDGIEYTGTDGKYHGFKSHISAERGELATFRTPEDISRSTKLYKTSSDELLKRAGIIEKIRFRDIDMRFTAKIGAKPTLDLSLSDGSVSVNVQGDGEVEAAKNKALAPERIEENLLKLGDTCYSANNVEVDIDDGIFLPISAINALRRDGTNALDKKLLDSGRTFDELIFKRDKSELFKTKNRTKSPIKLNVSVMKASQLKQINPKYLSRLYVEFYNGLDSYEEFNSKGVEVFLRLPPIMYKEDFERADRELLGKRFDGVMVSNLGQIDYVKSSNYFKGKKIVSDYNLNVFNPLAAEQLRELSIEEVSTSLELNERQLEILREKTDVKLEYQGYGYVALMTMEHCPMAVIKGCKDSSECSRCVYRSGHKLKDRKDYEFPMERLSGRTVIFNSSPTVLLDNLDKVVKAGADSIRIDFTVENEYISEIQEAYHTYLFQDLAGYEIVEILGEIKRKTGATNGHFFRGVE